MHEYILHYYVYKPIAAKFFPLEEKPISRFRNYEGRHLLYILWIMNLHKYQICM